MTEPTDFNDLARAAGLDEVRKQVKDAKPVEDTPGKRKPRLKIVQTSALDQAQAEQEDAPMPPPEGSEDAIAQDVADQHHHELSFVPGMGWMTDVGTHWASDVMMVRYQWTRSIVRVLALEASDRREQKRLASAKSVNSVVQLLQADPKIITPVDAYDRDPHMLNTPAGLVDLQTGKLRERAGDRVTQLTRVSPDPRQKCPVWSAFLRDVFDADRTMIEFMQRTVGYTMTAERREQKLFFMFGLGANGKSTFWDVIQWMLGTYAMKLPASVLMRSNGDRHPTEIAQLHRKRLAISSELDEGQHLNESRVKELTGDATITARYMRQDFFEFALTQKHVMVGNYRPRIQGGDAAMARRIVLVPFNATFSGKKRDMRLAEKLQAEAPAIMAWAVRGAVAWYSDGLGIPASVQAASAEYMVANDDVVQWFEECCERDVLDERTKAGLLYTSFAHWIKARGQHAMAMRTWAERMSAIPGMRKVKASSIFYLGVRLKIEEIKRMSAQNERWTP